MNDYKDGTEELVIMSEGIKIWYRNGLRHREDGPATVYPNGSKMWFKNDLLHRDDGPALDAADGSKFWYQNGLRHRVDGPAIIKKNGGVKEWWLKGRLHRDDGPAIELECGWKAWYYNGFEYSEKDYKIKIFREKIKKKIALKYFRLWDLKCDQPGKRLFEIRMKRSMENINFKE